MFERIKVTKIKDHIYLMDDAGESTGYLVIGKNKALVIDTMNGYENVMEVVRSITDLPVMVVNTHGHCDHIFGNVFFDKAYIHKADLEIANNHMHFPDFVERCEKNGWTMPPFETIEDGEVIDLGGLTLDVIHLPGHTPGELMLLCREDRILFTGDAINHHLWMQLEESLSMPDFVKALDKVMYLTDKADYILYGHATGLEDISLMKRLYKGAVEIAEGETENDEPYNWFGGQGKQHKFDEESVICYKEQ